MYEQPFKTEELKSALEHSLGFALRPLVRIAGGGAINYIPLPCTLESA